MPPGETTSLRSVVETSVGQLGAQLLAADEHHLVVGYQELELQLRWSGLQAILSTAPLSLWPETVAESLLEAAGEARAGEDDWATVQERVRPVVIGQAAGREMLSRCPEVVAFPYASNLLVLVGHPTTTGWRFVTLPALEAWPPSPPQLLGTALQNLRRDTPDGAVQALEPHHYALDTGDGFDSARLLLLSELQTDSPAAGAIAIVPAREVLNFVPFTRAGVQHLVQLIGLASRCHATWAYPIDPGLFYVRGATAYHLPVTTDGDGAPHLDFPAELAEIQAQLVADGLW